MMDIKKLTNIATGQPNIFIDLRRDLFVYIFPIDDKWEGVVYNRDSENPSDDEAFRTPITNMEGVIKSLMDFKDPAFLEQEDKKNKIFRYKRN